jgi:DNA-binding HxlR family transcriptional regulator
MRKRLRRHFTCPAELTFHVLGGKWRGAVVGHLSVRAMRYSELRRAIPQLSDKVLSETLRELEGLRVVARATAHGEASGFTVYCLTARGQAMIPLLRLASAWARTHGSEYAVEFLHGPPCAPNTLQAELENFNAEATTQPVLAGAQ